MSQATEHEEYEYDYDKYELLEDVDEGNKQENGLGIGVILTSIGLLILALSLAAPKIYISSNIYYMSLETDSLLASYKSLQEENRYLSQRLENMRYKNSILTSIEYERNKTQHQ